jgi:hypothetical protein
MSKTTKSHSLKTKFRCLYSHNNNNNNKQDIIRDNGRGACVRINVTISGVRNVLKKEFEKILKYKDLAIET